MRATELSNYLFIVRPGGTARISFAGVPHFVWAAESANVVKSTIPKHFKHDIHTFGHMVTEFVQLLHVQEYSYI